MYTTITPDDNLFCLGVALYNNTDGTCNLLLRAQFKALLADGADPLREDMWGHSAVDVARRMALRPVKHTAQLQIPGV